MILKNIEVIKVHDGQLMATFENGQQIAIAMDGHLSIHAEGVIVIEETKNVEFVKD